MGSIFVVVFCLRSAFVLFSDHELFLLERLVCYVNSNSEQSEIHRYIVEVVHKEESFILSVP